MRRISRRDVVVGLPAMAAMGVRAEAQMGSTQGAMQSSVVSAAASPGLETARVFAFDALPVRTMANGGESRDIVHGALKTGETVALHQSTQVVGAKPNPLHVIQHSEFILVREGTLEFQREGAAPQMVGPGGVIYVAYGTNHTVRNAGDVPAKYFVVAIGGDAK